MRQCSKGDSCSFRHDPASGNRCDQRQEGQPSSPAPKAKAQTERYPQKSSGRRGESPSGTRGKMPCRSFRTGKCTNLSCNYRPPPVCVNYKSESACKYGDKCRFRHAEADAQRSKMSKKSGVKGSVALLKESIQLGCVSLDSYPRKSVLHEEGKLGSRHAVEFSKGAWHQRKILERKGPSRGIIQKCEENLVQGKKGNWDQIEPSNSPRARGTTKKTEKRGSVARRHSEVRTSRAQSVRPPDMKPGRTLAPTSKISRGARIRG